MGLKCGLVGLPNVGKSSLFNALTKSSVPAENFAFCTIDPHLGIVSIPDPRLNEIAKIVQPQKIIPNTMEFVDIAGLVAGASNGEGLGNKFLSHIRETNAILHIVRCFESGDIGNIMDDLNPLKAVEIINTELALSDLETAGNAMAKHSRKSGSGDKEARILCTLLEERIIPHLDENKPLRTLNLSPGEWGNFSSYGFLTLKPVIYVINMQEDNNTGIREIQQLAQQEGSGSIEINVKQEMELMSLNDDERIEFMRELGMEESALELLIRRSYELLGLMTFFTAGPKEARAWNLKKGATAVEAAGTIHSDFIKHFIRAEVVGYQDYVNSGGEQEAKKRGLWRLESKDYYPQEGDIIYFRTSA